MKKVINFLSEKRHFFLLLIFIILMFWFEYCEKYIPAKYIMHTDLDERIPFIKEFVVPYLVWYLYMGFGFVYLGFKSKKDYYKLLIFMAGGMTVTYFIYMLLPTAQDLRPVIMENDIFSRTIKFLYTYDTPTNVCPSIHVFNSIAVYAALRNSAEFNTKKWANLISFITMILICLSTLFIKQHSIIDLVCAVALSIVFYVPLYFVPNMKKSISYIAGDN